MAYVDYEGNGGSYTPPDEQISNPTPDVTLPVPSGGVWSEQHPFGGVGTPGYKYGDPPVRDNTPAPVNTNPWFNPGTNITPGVDIPLAKKAVPTPTDPTGGRPTGGSLTDPAYAARYVAWAATQPGVNPSVKNDPGYWIGRFTSGAFGNDQEYAIQRMMQAEGAPEGASGGGGGYTGPAVGPNPGGYTDPSSLIYLNQLMARLQQVQQPQDTAVMDLLKSLALKRVDALNAPPYSASDEQALIAKYREPLTMARDAAYQRNKETASAHGFAPSSGLLRRMDTNTNVGYEQGIAQGANQMGVNAVAQKQANAAQQLQILSGLLSTENSQFDRSNARSDQAVALAKMFPDFDAQRLDQLLRASSDSSGGTALSSLLQLGNLNLNTLNTNNTNNQANSEAWGKILAGLIAAASGH